MFGRFIKPRWKHSRPEVRRRALAQIDDPEILCQIANSDPANDIRIAAIDRIDDLETLTRIAIAPEIETALNRRFAELLSKARHEPGLAALIDNQLQHRGGLALQTEIALHSDDAGLRQWLVPRITDTALLERLAAGDNNAEVRRLAAERLEDPASIRRTLKALGHKDKRVTRLLKQRLEALEQTRQRREAIDTLLDEIDTLGHTAHWQRDHTRLMSLKNRWQTLQADADEPQRRRFDETASRAEARIADQRQREEADRPVVEAKESLCELARRFVAHLNERRRLSRTEADDLQTTLDALLADWNDLPALAERVESPLANRFHQQISAARREIERLLDNARHQHGLENIIERAEKRLASHALDAAGLETLERQWAQAALPADPRLAEEYRQHFQRITDQWRHRLEKQQQRLERGLEEIDALLARIDANLSQDKLGDSRELERRVRALLDELDGIPPARRQAIQQRLRELSPRIRELDGWRHWGTDRAREELIDEAERLVETEQTPEARCRAVSELRQCWKALSSIDHETNRRLWKRFDKACNEAWKPCAEHRRQQEAERQHNLSIRTTICDELEALLQQTTTESPDWRDIDRHFLKLRNRWRDAGPVKRSDWKAIHKRYRQLLDAMNRALEPERTRNHRQRVALIEGLEALIDSDDLEAAKQAVREAQKQWRITVAGKRSVERTLWKRFKAAGDAIFAREKQRLDRAREQTRSALEEKAAICEALEQLAESPEEIPQRLQRLESQWDEIELPPGKEASRLQQRYRDALRAIDFALERVALEARLAKIEARCQALDTSDDAQTPNPLAETLIELEILCDIPSPDDQAEARMARKVERLNAHLNERQGDDDLDRAIALFIDCCDSLGQTAIDPDSKARLEAIREALASTLTTRIEELRHT